MPGDPPSDAPPASPVRCPVHRVEITPCDAAELQALLDHLGANQASPDDHRFPRGALLSDGRLDLCKQSLGADNCLLITQALHSNTQVRSLMLGTDAIGDLGAEAVARLAVGNPTLEVLYLGCNNIGPQGAQQIGSMLTDAPQVSGLWLKRNPLGPEGVRSIAGLLRRHAGLRVLDLVNTDLRDEGVRALVDALCSDNRSLRHLYLSGNGLGPTAAPALSRLLREAPHLQGLYLSVNRLGDEGVAVLADGLAANRTLQALELASNGVGPAGAAVLFDAVRPHPALQILNLGHAPSTRVLGSQANGLFDEGAGHAADLLAASSSLARLDLTRTGITTRGVERLAAAMTRNERLVDLRLDLRLPPALNECLRRNRARHGELPWPQDLSMIRSVYR